MLLQDKTAVVYGAAGHIGGAVARAFAADGARVFLAGRTLEKVRRLTTEINAAGGRAEAAEVDALNKQAVEDHLGAVVEMAGAVDISFNAIGIRGDLQGTPLVEMTLEDFTLPVEIGIKTHFLTATAAARHMAKKGSGVILTLSSTAAGLSGRDRVFHRAGGFATACTAIEALSRTLAGELGPQGIRVVCLRSDAIPETWPPEFPDHPVETKIYEQAAETKIYMEKGTALGRLPKLREIADAAVLMASDRASAMTGTIANLTCGSIMDLN
ncbi:NADP-dependent 3-hydroxy acid dehydrogenase YdfG [Mesorhizobium albiziae]|uniref:NADP-dependent 3-hydroxy acid dehydrogenase YdfG n=1 Tax=Neomesorhizobium albiziae TaxID=335020 RepID=A0A1I3UY40_9HYPH|nr:SDR family oxidoreductase [Mesorhizobium albiziae]GLS28561.1 3-oxoacyl-ACP reductase [Mesorhizobium albiziae]SFJ88304.1 NADP-dependent 3-hydroxy acid dehydrogenase YdfG [Mesorhizobium albiziae]